MRNKGKTLLEIDEAQISINLCINGLKSRRITPVEVVKRLEKANEKLEKAITHINTNNETP